MMTRSVHFSTTNIAYSPIPWSSPGASTSSLPPSPSSEAHCIPPADADDGAHYHSTTPAVQDDDAASLPVAPAFLGPWSSPHPNAIALRQQFVPPSPFIGPVQLHFLLAYSPFRPPHIHYELSHPLHTINSQVTPAFLDPATYPPTSALTIICRHIKWPVLISSSYPQEFVTVMDVFRAVYTGLRRAVLPAEYETLADREDKAGVDGSYYTRCKLRPDGPERQLETLKGVKRVDFLKGRNRFLGLSGPIGGPHVWELNVA
ncbi:hypothetical protein C8J57DRAFT_1303982 [Mycena rebaudengoi]|nr:hypothetical protein C8J57DRAFT_1303982 [Mycena rebaudengoi]